MKNKNISLCVIATALLMGKSVKATDFVIVKDNTVIVNQACLAAAYKTNRPPVKKRLFTSKAVETEILRVKKLLTNQKLAWMFEIVFRTHLKQPYIIGQLTVNRIPLYIQEIFTQCGYVIPVRRYGLIYSWLIKTLN